MRTNSPVDDFIITQYFAETKEEEGAILSAFLQELCHYQTVISFNGLGFDIPYLKKKCEKYGLTHPFDEKDYIDIYKEVSGLKFLLKLPDYKQKTIERFLGLSRNDTFSGGELIEVYQNYLKTPDEQAMFFLKQHNYEDVLGMTGLIAIRSYSPLDEVLKDADILQHVLQNTTLPIRDKYEKRFEKLKKEFSL